MALALPMSAPPCALALEARPSKAYAIVATLIAARIAHCRSDCRRPRITCESPAAKRSRELEIAMYNGPPASQIAKSVAISPRQYTNVNGNIIQWSSQLINGSKPPSGCVKTIATSPRTTLKKASARTMESAEYGRTSSPAPPGSKSVAVFDKSTNTGTRQLTKSETTLSRPFTSKRCGNAWEAPTESAARAAGLSEANGSAVSTASRASTNEILRLPKLGSETERRTTIFNVSSSKSSSEPISEGPVAANRVEAPREPELGSKVRENASCTQGESVTARWNLFFGGPVVSEPPGRRWP
mmetsp:Transcript_83384/g.232549  ORF Transcript_83384/g.232549 Transcript_83384/m.232549 type:complete len:299 (-) Transcript_83384:98-994(-)